MTSLLNENLERNDLKDLVGSLFFVDRHVSKMGADSDVCVLTFKTKNKGSAQDIVDFLEKSFTWIMDADISSGADEHQKWSVFVEIARNNKLHKHIQEVIAELENLTDKMSWHFKYKKDPRTHRLLPENLTMIPDSSQAYIQSLQRNVLENVKQFFEPCNIHHIEMDTDGSVRLRQQITEWTTGTEIGFKIIKQSDRTPCMLSPDLKCRTIGSILGGNFVVESDNDKFYIYNGSSTLEVQGLYAEKRSHL